MDDFDINCYIKIVEYLESGPYSRREITILVSKTLLTLMKLTKERKSKEVIANGINLAISYLNISFPQTYNSVGVDITHLDEVDKHSILIQLKDSLKHEFIPH